MKLTQVGHQPGPDNDNVLKGKIYDKNDETSKNKTRSHRRSSQGGWCGLKIIDIITPYKIQIANQKQLTIVSSL